MTAQVYIISDFDDHLKKLHRSQAPYSWLQLQLQFAGKDSSGPSELPSAIIDSSWELCGGELDGRCFQTHKMLILR